MTSYRSNYLNPLSLSPGVLCCLENVPRSVLQVRSAAMPGWALMDRDCQLVLRCVERCSAGRLAWCLAMPSRGSGSLRSLSVSSLGFWPLGYNFLQVTPACRSPLCLWCLLLGQVPHEGCVGQCCIALMESFLRSSATRIQGPWCSALPSPESGSLKREL